MHISITPEIIFKALSDNTRLRILHLLVISGEEICVCEFTDSLEIPQYNISRSLSHLLKSGLVKCKKEGRWAYYSVNQNINSEFHTKLFSAVASIENEKTANDLKEFTERRKCRVNGRCVTGITKEKLASKEA